MDDVFVSNLHNQKGNRESAVITRLNNELLLFNHGAWDNPPESIIWAQNHVESRDKIIANFLEKKHPFWGFKDPRTLINVDFWLEGLNGIDIQMVGSFRHPVAVANSLFKRNNIPLDQGLSIWERYNIKFLQLYEKYHFNIISFDVSFEEYQHAIQRIVTQLELPLDLKMDGHFFDESLRHNGADDAHPLPDNIKAIYETLLDIYSSQSNAQKSLVRS